MEILFKRILNWGFRLLFEIIFEGTTCNWKVLYCAILILNLGEHLCVAPEKIDSIEEVNVVGFERNFTAAQLRESLPALRRKTISSNETFNNSSLPFRFHFSPSLLFLRRMKRSVSDEDQEKLNEDHARSFRLFYFLGGIAIVLFSIIFLATLLCFCCPSCYMAKRRRPGADSLSGSGAAYQSSGSAGAQETTISAARSSSIVMAALPLHRASRDFSTHRLSHDYGENAVPSTSQSAFTYNTYPDTAVEIEDLH